MHTSILLTLLPFFFLTFFALPILKTMQIYHVLFLFGVTPGVNSFAHHFGAINKKQNGEQNFGWNVCY